MLASFRTGRIRVIFRCLSAIFTLLMIVPGHQAQASPSLEDSARTAYIFGYPLVLMAETRASMTAAPSQDGGLTFRLNEFTHIDRLPEPEDDQVIRPNVDTLYSVAWLDLSQGPIRLEWPGMDDRYWVFQILDGWTDVVASPGTRTVGNEAGAMVLARPDDVEAGAPQTSVVEIDTDIAWIIGRVATSSAPADLARANSLQRQFILSAPASTFPQDHVAGEARPHDTIAQITPTEYFRRLDGLLGHNPPRPADTDAAWAVARVLEAIEKGEKAELDAITEGVTKARDFVDNEVRGRDNLGPNGWRGGNKGLGRYGTNYAFRARVARMGLGANLPEDAVYMSTEYDVEGALLNGANRYRIHFGPDELPPVHGFWSITLYGMDGFLTPSPNGKHALGDRDNLIRGNDGGITIQLSASPPKEEDVNWLPAPAGEGFNLTARFYYPKDDILSGKWQMPAVRRLETSGDGFSR